MNVDPHGFLDQAHPDLAEVVRTAAQAPVAFVVVYGLRTPAAEAEAVASGHSQTLHSRHLAQAGEHGLACAIDFCVVDAGGDLDWTVADAAGGKFGQVAQQLQHAADALGVPIEWGGAAVGAWVPGEISHFHDWGHVQLPWARYP
jgi:peptidoglycan L-alanyl-D-glutamate endopeptidase CwlK